MFFNSFYAMESYEYFHLKFNTVKVQTAAQKKSLNSTNLNPKFTKNYDSKSYERNNQKHYNRQRRRLM